MLSLHTIYFQYCILAINLLLYLFLISLLIPSLYVLDLIEPNTAWLPTLK